MIEALERAQKDIWQYLDSFFNTKEEPERAIREFLDFVSTKVVCIHHVAQTMETALTIYARLNSGGKTLENIEILKGLTFQQAELLNLWDPLEKEWNDLEAKLATKVKAWTEPEKEPIAASSFIRYYLFLERPEIGKAVSAESNGWVDKKDLFKVITGENLKTVLEKSPINFMQDLKQFTDEIITLRTPASNTDPIIQNYLYDIAFTAKTQSQWLLLGIPLMRYFPSEQDAFRKLRNMVFMFSFALRGSGTSSQIYKQLGSLVRKDAKPDPAALAAVVTGIDKNLNEYWPAFESEVRRLRYTSGADKIALRRLFEFMEVEIQRRHAGATTHFDHLYSQYKIAGITLDHLIPQSDTTIDDSIKHQIGNLCLLTKTDNSGRLKTPYKDPKSAAVFEKARWIVTNALVTAPSTVHGAKKRAIKEFTQYPDMTKTEVENRTDELIEYLKQRLLT